MGNKMRCCKRQETFGMDRSKFKKTYSPIFCPFLISVVVKLLNDAGQTSFNYRDLVSRWGGGIKLLRKCAKKNALDPNNEHCNWDTLIVQCAAATPISHPVWNELLKYNKIKRTTSHTQNLENLLMQWVENGHKYRTFGPYPKAYEQELYIQDTIPTNISEILNYAIISDVFAESYAAMQEANKNKIRDSIAGPRKTHIHVPDNSGGDTEMTEVTAHDTHTNDTKSKAIQMDIRPTRKGSTRIHCGLWIGILMIALIIVFIMIWCSEQYMVMSWMNYSNDGFWYTDWGWNSHVVHDDTKNGIPIQLTLINSQRIQNDISQWMPIVFVWILAILVAIVFILLMRLKEKKGYYFHIGRIKVPQRPMVYVLLEMITIPCVCSLVMFTMLLIYGMMELIPWTRLLCNTSGNDQCRRFVFPLPHMGFVLLLFIPFAMQCWIYKYADKLDYKLDYKSMRVYYPEHYAKVVSNQQGIYLYDLLDGMCTLRRLLILMLFALCLQDSGMIMWVHVTDTGDRSTSSIYLEPLGLNNTKRFDGAWVNAGAMLTVCCVLSMIMHLVLLCYFIYVFVHWRVRKMVKYVCLLLVTLEIVIWFILGLVFYFDFNTYWNTHGLGQKITDIGDDVQNTGIKNYWIPDYGIILHLSIWVLMFKLWYRITKAM
eukprot:68531_1